MVDLSRRIFDVGRMDMLARQDTPLHRLDPRAKLVTTALFIVVVLSFDKLTVSALLPFVSYPLFLAALGGIPAGFVVKKMIWVAPFAVLIGIFNPVFETTPAMQIGSVVLSEGWISFGSILLRFALTVGATLLLVAVTGLNPLLSAADRLGAPRVLTVQIMFLYRYLFVLGNETLRMLRARSLRSVGHRGRGITGFGALVGQLLLRTLDRAERIHRAMVARGFSGEIRLVTPLAFGPRDAAFLLIWAGVFVILRWIPVTHVIGGALLETVG